MKYESIMIHKEYADSDNFLVNSFWEVGMQDPFPDDEDLIIGSVDDVPDDFKLPTCPTDMVYPDSRYIDGNSPVAVYIPTPEVMLKMMRACIEVKDPKDLWIHQPSVCDKKPKVVEPEETLEEEAK